MSDPNAYYGLLKLLHLQFIKSSIEVALFEYINNDH